MRINQTTKCLPFIQYSSSKGYQIDQQALQYLSTLPQNDNYTVLTITGKSKTGKSFLLNQLLGDNKMFSINNHIDSCTSGIMISTKLLEVNGIKVIVLDSEGFGSLSGSDDRDCKFFILSLLFSSVILYNSMGTIDQQTLNNFSMIIQIGKIFQKQLTTQQSIPALFWIIRDFTLQMLDKTGHSITPKQYLQLALQEQKNTQPFAHKNRIRKTIKQLFISRTCQTLLLPTQELPLVLNSQENNLRQQFVKDFIKLKGKLLNFIHQTTTKQPTRSITTISNFINSVQFYAKYLNKSILQGSIPKLQTIHTDLQQYQLKAIKNKFTTYLKQKKKQILLSISSMGLQNKSIYNFDDIIQKYLQPIEQMYNITKQNIQHITKQYQLDQLQLIKTTFYQQLQHQCTVIINKYSNTQSVLQSQIDNICQFLKRIPNEKQLDHEYSIIAQNLKQKHINPNTITFKNTTMKIQILYLKKKLQFSKQIYNQFQQIYRQLELTKKQLKQLQIRNSSISTHLVNSIKQSKKNYLTPNKSTTLNYNSNINQPSSTYSANQPIKKPSTNSNHHNYSSKIESSSFYIPYIFIQKPNYISTKIIKTLFKQDSKHNSSIQYVIEINLLGQKWTVNRKFKDFSQLHNLLLIMFQNKTLPNCQTITDFSINISKFNTTKKQIIQSRCQQLSLYLQQLILIQDVRNSRIMQKFIKINKQYTIL